MMVEQTDLVRLRMVRMSNVPDTLYMVNNAVPQCCHVISHQQISSNQSSPPSVVANEIPGKAVNLVPGVYIQVNNLVIFCNPSIYADSFHLPIPFMHCSH